MAKFYILLMYLYINKLYHTNAIFPTPRDAYVMPGDVYIGSLIYLRGRESFTACADSIDNVYGVQMHLAEVYAIEKINKDPDILGNIKLGYIAKEECFVSFMSVRHSLEYLGIIREGLTIKTLNNGSLVQDVYPVVGITGPLGTTSSMAVAGLLTLYQTPQISQTATNDILSDRGIYPYFYRTVPPDSFQTKVMMDTLSKLNWTYVSVVHDDDTYGYNAIKYIRRYSYQKGMCIADSFPVDDGADEEYFYNLAWNLLKIAKFGSHGVILFLSPKRSQLMIEAMSKRYDGSTKIFFFLSADSSWISTFEGSFEYSVGCLTISWSKQSDQELGDYLKRVSPKQYPENVFLNQTWDDLSGCKNRVEAEECYNKTMGELGSYFPVSDTAQSALGIYAYAYAIDQLVKDRCPSALNTPFHAKDCVTPSLVNEYLKKVKIPQKGKNLSFDENGAIIGDFRVNQLQKQNGGYVLQQVGIWPQSLEDIDLDLESFQWGFGEFYQDGGIPESLCAKPCGLGEAYIQGELSCCWECRRCRNNEFVTNNSTSCEICPYLTWPDSDTYTTCSGIPESYLNWRDLYGITLLFLACMGLLIIIIILVEVIQNKNRRVIKGAIFDMQIIIICGIIIAFGSVVLYILPASDIVCISARVTFTVSCTMIFGPVFVKTQLVFQVFKAAEKFKRSVKMASTYVKVSLTIVVFLIQIGLLAVSLVLWPIKAIYKMPVRSERYVELQCDQELEGFLIPLGYNMLLLSLCSIFAFLTRKLPENFNESWYIFVSVSTTLFVWVAFFPTYFSAFYAYHKAALLALALILNGIVTIVCFFAPKIYALHFVGEKDIKVSDFTHSSFRSNSMHKTTVSVVDT